MSRKTKQQPLELKVINPCSAAIDIGSMMMMVSYSNREGQLHLLEVAAFTDDLERLAKTLQAAGVIKVAMEATGFYWYVVYDMLERYGFETTLVNPRHFKNVDGQKTDVKDCQWLHQLHANGLLKASHIAGDVYRELRSYLHERQVLQLQKSDTLNRIQKVLTQMNIKVQHLISDIEGVSGMKLLRGIANGISDAKLLIALIDVSKLKANEEDLLKSLTGVFKKQFVVILKNLLVAYDFSKTQMKTYELLIEKVLITMQPENCKNEKIQPKTTLVRKNQYAINLKKYFHNIIGVDLTAIDGIDEISILEIISVTGLDMNKWRTADHFTSWLNLAPRPKKSGGKIIGYEKRFTNNRATQAFRMAAQSMWQNKGSLGHLYRRLAAQKGSKKAIKAVARKLAVIFYHMVKNKTSFDKNKIEVNEARKKLKKIAYLKKEAIKYGYCLNSIND